MGTVGAILTAIALALGVCAPNQSDARQSERTAPHTATTHRAKRCMEDNPCWDWTKHGNRMRGVILKTGDREAMGMCEFWQAHERGDFDLADQKRLKGDSYALKHGCE